MNPIPSKAPTLDKVAWRPAADLAARSNNPRIHSKKQVRQIADSIRRFGWTNPVLVDEAGILLAGHGRLEAAKLLGQATVPTLVLSHLNEAEKRAYVVADNRLAELAGWDKSLLAIELKELSILDPDLDLTLTGFDMGEIDVLILGEDGPADGDPADDLSSIPDGPAITHPGDLWQIGEHRLLCGDSLQSASYAALMGTDRARLVISDPPYNVPVAGHVRVGDDHREFVMASGEMSAAEFETFLATAFTRFREASLDGAIQIIAMDWRHLSETLAAGTAVYDDFKNLCVWTKSNPGMGSLYRSQHELFLVFKAGKAPHVNNVELGVHGRNRTNVWSYAGATGFGPDRAEMLALHPTVKPVALVADAILDCSNRHDIVLDGFAGSGTILLAAQRTGRRARAIEIDPIYVDRALRRCIDAFGIEPIHIETGKTFSAIAAERAAH